ncbi:Catechol-2,3-dioxygenase [bacterium HR19]|nr:Catechol-2,3-dioxygenase [bacterium HR19]
MREETIIEEIELKVHDLEKLTEFYEKTLGFKVFEKTKDRATLGAGKNPFLKLVRDEKAKEDDPKGPGLYHVAYLIPERKDLAIILKHLLKVEAPIEGFANHIATESVYLQDPEGNHIEIYCDKPASEWINSDGKILMDTLPLDIESLLILADQEKFERINDNTKIGHIHLRVSNLSKAELFYSEILGLNITLRWYGAIFLSFGGYHHHIGANIWHSSGAKPKEENTKGLSYFKIKLPSKEHLEKVIQNLENLQIKYTKKDNEIYTRDFDNIKVVLC